MKPKTRTAALAFALAAVVGCTPLSEHVEDPSAGWNGGFEQARDGLPANWLVYSPRTVPEGSFDVRLDSEDFREGRQSLRFDVRACADEGGWRSPGIAAEVPGRAGRTYAVRFWIKSEGCAWTATVGGVDAKTGSSATPCRSDGSSRDWHPVECRTTLTAPHERLRFELSITSAGRLWIDDVRIEEAGRG